MNEHDMMNLDQRPVLSTLSREVTRNGVTVRVDIYTNGEGGWILELVDRGGNSTVWEDDFSTDQVAFEAALRIIDGEGRGHLAGTPSGNN